MPKNIISVSLLCCTLYACAANDNSTPDTFTLFQSTKNSSLSHNVGQNCLDCHAQAASGRRPQFTLAGTVYTDANGANIYPNVDVELIVNGSVAKDIPVDNLGNFYTNDTIPWSDGPQPQVKTSIGSLKMTPHLSVASSGGCAQSNCHNIGGNQGSVYGP